MESKFAQVRKRDGRVVPFDRSRIASAVAKAMRAAGEGALPADAERIGEAVVEELGRRFPVGHAPHIEEIQDAVEQALILHDFPKTAKAYILYRHERARLRELARQVPERLTRLVAESRRYFPSALAELTYYRTYSRWLEEEGRRETWVETIDRYVAFMRESLGGRLSEQEYQEVRSAILHQRVMPSMRLLWSAGPGARATHVAAYNCAYVAPTCIADLSEIMYLLMCGAGVGFSVESQFAQQLPLVRRQSGERLPAHQVADSKEGWCEALKAGLTSWFGGQDLGFDLSQVRPAGSRLRTMGGRASGPGTLKALLEFCRAKVLGAQGKRLRNVDLHDIICKIGEVVVMGGVRRSALISLSELDDEQMRESKSGHFYVGHPERAMANNSAVYERQPSAVQFLEEWIALARSRSGERGLFNRGSILEQLPERRRRLFEPDWASCGTNPCGEIILRSKQFCNLSEVVARPNDGAAQLLEKVRLAALIGTYQSTLTRFPYLSSDWRRKCEEERLLGVSITGQWDCAAARDGGVLRALKEAAIEANRHYAQRFGIQPSAAITCVKPSGTVSLLVDSSSGMHPRHARWYLRRIRISAVDPLLRMLRDQKLPLSPEVGQVEGQATTYVLELPVRAPEGAVVRDDLGAIDQLEHWKRVKHSYTEHNPSVTVSVGQGEWIATADWLYRNWALLGGLSFLPRSDTVYQLAPLEEISSEEYHSRLSRLPPIDFSRLVLYEREDQTAGARALACVGDLCELDPEEGSFPSGPAG
ncbi:MAG: ribonucleoside-triphosphate reductase [Myxococcales bacterium]|nr:ribonucleoside-triphosphate reductase [Myxococcales bacterium]